MSRPALALALALSACGGSSFMAGNVLDAGDELEARADAAGELEARADASGELEAAADVAGDQVALDVGEDLEARADVAGDVLEDPGADVCTPVTWPTGTPPGCVCVGPPQAPCSSAGSAGCLWAVGPVSGPSCSSSSGCWAVPFAAAAPCQQCAERYTCACLRPMLIDAGLGLCGCVDSPMGPYLEGC